MPISVILDVVLFFVLFLGGAFAISFATFWTYFKGRELKTKGANLSPIVWAILVYSFFIITFPIFLILWAIRWKKEAVKPSVPRKLGQGQRILVIIAFIGVYILTCILFAISMAGL